MTISKIILSVLLYEVNATMFVYEYADCLLEILKFYHKFLLTENDYYQSYVLI